MTSKSRLGVTIKEKTLNLLGWNEDRCIATPSSSSSYSLRFEPYTRPAPVRTRRVSGGSTCSSDYSQFSPGSSTSSLSDSPFTPNYVKTSYGDARILEKLRTLVPNLSNDRNAIQILLDSVSEAMECDQIEDIEDKPEVELKKKADVSREQEMAVLSADLESVDVSAFKHLIYLQPLHFEALYFR